MSANIVLIGAGGHAKVILQILSNLQYQILGFIDDGVNHFFDVSKIDDDLLFSKNANAIISFGATTVQGLKKRTDVFKSYSSKSISFPTIVDVSALVAKESSLAAGVTVSPGAVINANAIVHEAVIINTRAIIEHDVTIGQGSHIAPGAIVLGGATIGKNCLVGAGAVILPNVSVPDETLVSSLTRYTGGAVHGK